MKFKVQVKFNNKDKINFETMEGDYYNAEDLINNMLDRQYCTIHNAYINKELAKIVINNNNVNYIVVK